MRRRGDKRGWAIFMHPRARWVLIIGMVLFAGSVAAAGKSRKIRSKGITYALDLGTHKGSALTLRIEPASNAWLSGAYGAQNHGVTRMGRGLRWTCVDSTQRTGTQGHIYLEAEPLAGKEFDAAAIAYKDRLRDLWRHAGRSLSGSVRAKPGKPVRLGKLRVPTYRYRVTTQRTSDGAKMPTQTILFPVAGHLVALTAEGAPDFATRALRTLRVCATSKDGKARVQHVAYAVGGQTSFFVLKTPSGYRLDPVQPTEDDGTLLARWRRTKERGAPATLTLVRLARAVGATKPAEVVAYWGEKLAKREEGEADAPCSFQIDGEAGAALVWRSRKKDSEPTAWGWLVAWRSGEVVFALQSETTSKEDAEAVAAEVARTAEKLLTWYAR